MICIFSGKKKRVQIIQLFNNHISFCKCFISKCLFQSDFSSLIVVVFLHNHSLTLYLGHTVLSVWNGLPPPASETPMCPLKFLSRTVIFGFFIYTGCKSLVRYMFSKYFLPIYSLIFHYHNGVYKEQSF